MHPAFDNLIADFANLLLPMLPMLPMLSMSCCRSRHNTVIEKLFSDVCADRAK
jgi:hypothetical protein